MIGIARDLPAMLTSVYGGRLKLAMFGLECLLVRQRGSKVPVAVTEGVWSLLLPNLEEIGGVARSTLADAAMTSRLPPLSLALLHQSHAGKP